MEKKQPKQRTITAPQSFGFSAGELPANRVLSVELDWDEEVQWTWTVMPDGKKYVSGYTIHKSNPLI